MNPPTQTDRVVKVRAYLTDETFGYDYWAARQFSAPADARYAVLVICDSESERDALAIKLAALDATKAPRE
jgi:hypothetical protein